MKYKKATSKHLKELEKAFELFGTQTELAKKLKRTASSISLWYAKRTRVPFDMAIKLEKMSKGKISALELRPDIIKFLKKIDTTSFFS